MYGFVILTIYGFLGETGFAKVLEGVIPSFNNRMNTMQSSLQGYLNGLVEGQKLFLEHLERLNRSSEENKEMNQKMAAYCRHKTMWDFDMSQPRMSQLSQPCRNETDNSSPPQEDGAYVITGNVITQESNTQDDNNVNRTQVVCPESITVVTRPEYCLHKNHIFISSIWDEWHGQNSFSPALNSTCHAGGIQQLEMKYKTAWRKDYSAGDSKRFSRHRSIINNVKFLIGGSSKSVGDVITFLDKKCDEYNMHTITQIQVYMNKGKQELLADLRRTPTNVSTTAPAPSNATPTNVPAMAPTRWGFDSGAPHSVGH